jgi:integrase
VHELPRPLDQNAVVFPGISPDAITIGFRRLVKELKLSNLRFHDLRHDVASTLTMAGVPQRTVMEILGHKDPRMTLRYQHLSPGHLRQAIQVLEHGVPKSSQAKTASA